MALGNESKAQTFSKIQKMSICQPDGKYFQALVEDVAAEVYRRVISNRLIFVRQIFSELGFKRPELEVRTRIFVCYFSWERSIYPDISTRERDIVNDDVLTLLTKT